MEKSKGMLDDIIPAPKKREDGVQTISSIATFMVLGYSRTEVAEMVGLSEHDLASILSANSDLFKKEFERNRSLLMVNMESKVFKKIDEILNMDEEGYGTFNKDGDVIKSGVVLKEQVKLINGVMNLICKLQEKKVNIKTESKATKVIIDFVGLSIEDKKKAMADIREGRSSGSES